MAKQNVLKIRGNTLILEGFDKIGKQFVISFLYKSMVIYPFVKNGLKPNQSLYKLNENRKIIDADLSKKIRNHFEKGTNEDLDLFFLDSPIYALNLDSYIYLPSKQKLPK